MSKISIKPSSTGAGTFTIEAPNSDYNRNFTLPDESGVVITNNRQLSFRNKIINGNFDIWQRGTSFSGWGYTADRWVHGVNVETSTATRQEFPLGQTDVPGSPGAYLRQTVTPVTGAYNYSLLGQRVESVLTFSGGQAVLSFWAKANAAKVIAIEFTQNFGTGGSPSPHVNGIGVTKLNLTTTWQKYTVVVDIPSVAGKTLGTDNNHNLQLYIWLSAGSAYNYRTLTLGQQSITFDIAQVQLEAGAVATAFEERHIAEELALCQRYYSTGFAHTRSYATGPNQLFDTSIYFPAIMRAVPTLTIKDGGGRANTSFVGILSPEVSSARHGIISAAAGDCRAINDFWTADAEL